MKVVIVDIKIGMMAGDRGWEVCVVDIIRIQ